MSTNNYIHINMQKNMHIDININIHMNIHIIGTYAQSDTYPYIAT